MIRDNFLYNYTQRNSNSNISQNIQTANDVPVFDKILKVADQLIKALEKLINDEITKRVNDFNASSSPEQFSLPLNNFTINAQGVIETADNKKVNFMLQINFDTYQSYQSVKNSHIGKPLFVTTGLKENQLIGRINNNYRVDVANSFAQSELIDNFASNRSSKEYRENHRPYVKYPERNYSTPTRSLNTPSPVENILKDPKILKEPVKKAEIESVTTDIKKPINNDPDRGNCFVAVDKNYKGYIDDNGKQEFVLYGTLFGFEGLKKYDDNKDGFLDKSDGVFENLEIWRHRMGGREQTQIEQYGVAKLDLNKNKIIFNEV